MNVDKINHKLQDTHSFETPQNNEIEKINSAAQPALASIPNPHHANPEPLTARATEGPTTFEPPKPDEHGYKIYITQQRGNVAEIARSIIETDYTPFSKRQGLELYKAKWLIFEAYEPSIVARSLLPDFISIQSNPWELFLNYWGFSDNPELATDNIKMMLKWLRSYPQVQAPTPSEEILFNRIVGDLSPVSLHQIIDESLWVERNKAMIKECLQLESLTVATNPICLRGILLQIVTWGHLLTEDQVKEILDTYNPGFGSKSTTDLLTVMYLYLPPRLITLVVARSGLPGHTLTTNILEHDIRSPITSPLDPQFIRLFFNLLHVIPKDVVSRRDAFLMIFYHLNSYLDFFRIAELINENLLDWDPKDLSDFISYASRTQTLSSHLKPEIMESVNRGTLYEYPSTATPGAITASAVRIRDHMIDLIKHSTDPELLYPHLFSLNDFLVQLYQADSTSEDVVEARKVLWTVDFFKWISEAFIVLYRPKLHRQITTALTNRATETGNEELIHKFIARTYQNDLEFQPHPAVMTIREDQGLVKCLQFIVYLKSQHFSINLLTFDLLRKLQLTSPDVLMANIVKYGLFFDYLLIFRGISNHISPEQGLNVSLTNAEISRQLEMIKKEMIQSQRSSIEFIITTINNPEIAVLDEATRSYLSKFLTKKEIDKLWFNLLLRWLPNLSLYSTQLKRASKPCIQLTNLLTVVLITLDSLQMTQEDLQEWMRNILVHPDGDEKFWKDAYGLFKNITAGMKQKTAAPAQPKAHKKTKKSKGRVKKKPQVSKPTPSTNQPKQDFFELEWRDFKARIASAPGDAKVIRDLIAEKVNEFLAYSNSIQTALENVSAPDEQAGIAESNRIEERIKAITGKEGTELEMKYLKLKDDKMSQYYNRMQSLFLEVMKQQEAVTDATKTLIADSANLKKENLVKEKLQNIQLPSLQSIVKSLKEQLKNLKQEHKDEMQDLENQYQRDLKLHACLSEPEPASDFTAIEALKTRYDVRSKELWLQRQNGLTVAKGISSEAMENVLNQYTERKANLKEWFNKGLAEICGATQQPVEKREQRMLDHQALQLREKDDKIKALEEKLMRKKEKVKRLKAEVDASSSSESTPPEELPGTDMKALQTRLIDLVKPIANHEGAHASDAKAILKAVDRHGNILKNVKKLKTVLERSGFTLNTDNGGSHRSTKAGSTALTLAAHSSQSKPEYVKDTLEALIEVVETWQS